MRDAMKDEFHAAFVAKFGFGQMLASSNSDAWQMLNTAEWAWGQSRAALVVELPVWMHHSDDGMQIIEALTKAGVTVK